jgi:hypothetical protein
MPPKTNEGKIRKEITGDGRKSPKKEMARRNKKIKKIISN